MTRKRALLAALACTCATGLAQSIVQQPANQTVVQGGSAAFSVTVSGTGPFRYQWQFNGTNLPSPNIITTIAGSDSTNCFSGDGGPATNAALKTPTGLALDGVGNLIFTDWDNNRVREVGTNGIIKTLAGTGPGCAPWGANGPPDNGDGGPATNAGLWGPSYLVLDAAGDIFFTDDLLAGSQRVREIDTNGIISSPAYITEYGVLAMDRAGYLYASDSGCCVTKYHTNEVATVVAGNGQLGFSGDGGPATNASLNLIGGGGIAVDGAGNLFIADTQNGRVRKVDTNGIISTVAGDGSYVVSGDGGPAINAGAPGGNVGVDCAGNLFIVDSYDNLIREVDTNGIIHTVAGYGPYYAAGSYSGDGGPATNASLSGPSVVVADGVGNLIIADSFNDRIREVFLAGMPTLTISNVTMANAGQYSVVVSTAGGGSVTSSVATLTVTWPTLISKVIRNGDGSVGLSCLSAPNATNVLYVSGDLSVWQALSTNVAAGDGTWQYTDTNAAGLPARFYRFLTR